MFRMGKRLAAAAALFVFVVGCSETSRDLAVPDDPVSADVASSTTTEPNSHPTTTAVNGEAKGLRGGELPVSGDVCTNPASHVFGEFVEYEASLAGRTVPVGVKVGSADALDGGLLVLVLHGAGLPWQVSVDFRRLDSLVAAEWPEEQKIVFAPQAEAGDSPFWGQEDFNVDFLNDFFGLLSDSVCVDRGPVIVHSLGQGSLAATDWLCAAEHPIDLHVYAAGLVKTVECDGLTQPPILSTDQFTFNSLVGHHWDGEWTPPDAGLANRTGGVGATPDDLAFVAEQYGCQGEAEEVLFNDSGLSRDPVGLVYDEGCVSPLRAYGIPAVDSGVGWDPAALETIGDQVREDLLAALSG